MTDQISSAEDDSLKRADENTGGYTPEHNAELHAKTFLPVKIAGKGRITIGDEQFPFHVVQDSVVVQPRAGRLNLLTVTIPVGEVTLEGGEK